MDIKSLALALVICVLVWAITRLSEGAQHYLYQSGGGSPEAARAHRAMMTGSTRLFLLMLAVLLLLVLR